MFKSSVLSPQSWSHLVRPLVWSSWISTFTSWTVTDCKSMNHDSYSDGAIFGWRRRCSTGKGGILISSMNPCANGVKVTIVSLDGGIKPPQCVILVSVLSHGPMSWIMYLARNYASRFGTSCLHHMHKFELCSVHWHREGTCTKPTTSPVPGWIPFVYIYIYISLTIVRINAWSCMKYTPSPLHRIVTMSKQGKTCWDARY